MLSKVTQGAGRKECKIVSEEQKCFIPGKAGCLEHCYMVNMMMDDAISFRKEFYIVALDFKDAFGSVPHDLLRYNFTKPGI
jgi:hypothetical protein